MEIIEKLIHLDGIEIEICGTWIWLTGNTYFHREYLKEIGCRWSSGHKKWYWTEAPFYNKSSKKSMERIRLEYGSEKVATVRQDRLQ